VAEEAAVGDVSADAVAPWFQGPSGPIFWDPLSIAIDVHAYRILLTSVCPYDIHYQVQKVQYQLMRQRIAACTHERKCGAEARGNLQLPGRDSGDGGKSASELDALGSNGMGFSRPQQGGTFLSISRQHARR
jgi:hypothetical protein